jgi:K+-transporting ATPase KdpF subunit
MRKAQVSPLYVLGLIVSVTLFVYLLVALLAPERFQ